MKSVEIQPRAEAEAADAAAWYDAEHPGLGLQYLLELDAATERAAEDPLAYERVFLEARRVLLRRFPYSVYFIYVAGVVRVLAILHHRRHPSLWISRGQ